MKTLCFGYMTKENARVICGKLIKDGPEKDGEVSHGLCEDCFEATKKEYGIIDLEDRHMGLNDAGIRYYDAFKTCAICLGNVTIPGGICQVCVDCKKECERAAA